MKKEKYKETIGLSKEESDKYMMCKCKECGYEWNPLDTEHFNITFCEVCHSNNIGGAYWGDDID